MSSDEAIPLLDAKPAARGPENGTLYAPAGQAGASTAADAPRALADTDARSDDEALSSLQRRITGAEAAHAESKARKPIPLWRARLQLVTRGAIFAIMIVAVVLFTSSIESDPVLHTAYVMPNNYTYTALLDSTHDDISGAYYSEVTLTYPVWYESNATMLVSVGYGGPAPVWSAEEMIWLWTGQTFIVTDRSTIRFTLPPRPPGAPVNRVVLRMMGVNVTHPFGVTAYAVGLPELAKYDALYAGLILVYVYILISFELVHQMLAALQGSFLVLATLAALNKRPTLEEVAVWIDYDILALLFGMMVTVNVFSRTGFFEYMAVKAYRLSRGRVWSMITLLCVLSAVLSAFLDNVTTMLLMTPVTIRLCEVVNLEPQPVLVASVLFSNIGGTGTAVGDPPNVIIVNDPDLQSGGITFINFSAHMIVGAVIVAIGGYLMLRLLFRNITIRSPESPLAAELKREIAIWRRTLSRIAATTEEERHVKELLNQKVNTMEATLNEQHATVQHGIWHISVHALEERYRITDKQLFILSAAIISVVVLLFFLHGIVHSMHLEMSWIAVFGAVALLVLSGVTDIDGVIEKVEWTTMLFFGGLFVMIAGMGRLNLFVFVGDRVSEFIQSVPEHSQLAVAIIVLLWVSAIAAAFVDNIPLTVALIPVLLKLSKDPLNLPLQPLVWSLVMGGGLGGNGTVIGTSANIIVAGIAEQHGYPITFRYFFKIGFPVMLATTAVAMCYLLVCHVAFDWNS